MLEESFECCVQCILTGEAGLLSSEAWLAMGCKVIIDPTWCWCV